MERSAEKRAMEKRILDIVDRLFYGRGIRAIGVDTIADEVGISKRTLYNYYPSKDELITAYLARRLQPRGYSDEPPAQQILGEFDRLERQFGATGFRGCAFVNAVAELKEPKHAANKIALAFKEQRRMWFRELLSRLDVPTKGRACGTGGGAGSAIGCRCPRGASGKTASIQASTLQVPSNPLNLGSVRALNRQARVHQEMSSPVLP